MAPSASTDKKKKKKPETVSSGSPSSAPAPAPAPGKKRKFGEEIDDIFKEIPKVNKANKKDSSKTPDAGKKRSGDKQAHENGQKESIAGKMKKKKMDKDDMFESDQKTNRRRTNDGLAIYSAEELGFNNPNAGGTPLCPFDCECCF